MFTLGVKMQTIANLKSFLLLPCCIANPLLVVVDTQNGKPANRSKLLRRMPSNWPSKHFKLSLVALQFLYINVFETIFHEINYRMWSLQTEIRSYQTCPCERWCARQRCWKFVYIYLRSMFRTAHCIGHTLSLLYKNMLQRIWCSAADRVWFNHEISMFNWLSSKSGESQTVDSVHGVWRSQ